MISMDFRHFGKSKESNFSFLTTLNILKILIFVVKLFVIVIQMFINEYLMKRFFSNLNSKHLFSTTNKSKEFCLGYFFK